MCSMTEEDAHPEDRANHWTLRSGPTDTDNTGPDDDAVPGFIKGYYLYVDSSEPAVRNLL